MTNDKTFISDNANIARTTEAKLAFLKALEEDIEMKVREINNHIASTSQASLYLNAGLWELVELCKNDLVKYTRDLRDYVVTDVARYAERYNTQIMWIKNITKTPQFPMLGKVLNEAFELGNVVHGPPKVWRGGSTTVWELWVALLKLPRFHTAPPSRHWEAFGYFLGEDDESEKSEHTDRKRKRSIASESSTNSAASSPSAQGSGTSMQPPSAGDPPEGSRSRCETPLPAASTTGEGTLVSDATTANSLPPASRSNTFLLQTETTLHQPS